MAAPWRRGRRVVAVLLAAVALLLLVNVRTDLSLDELKPKYQSAASKFALIDDVNVHYRDEGSGPPLVLVHGTSSSLHTWDGWVAKLSPHRRVIRLDLPGYGLTGPAPDHDYSAARYARVVAKLLDHLGIERADIAGSSLGGRVTMTFALDYPARVRKLVLIDAAGLSGQRLPGIFRLARTPVLNRLLRWVTPRMIVKKNVAEVYGEPSRVTDELVDRYYDLLRREGNRQATIDRSLHGSRGPRSRRAARRDPRSGAPRVGRARRVDPPSLRAPSPERDRRREARNLPRLRTRTDGGAARRHRGGRRRIPRDREQGDGDTLIDPHDLAARSARQRALASSLRQQP